MAKLCIFTNALAGGAAAWYDGEKGGGTMGRIAVIDDDIHIGDMLEEVLRREGY